MQVRVLFFGVIKDMAGQTGTTIELGVGASLDDAFQLCQAKVPGLARFAGSIAMSVNHEYAGPQALLKDGDEIALLPPVSGGSPARVELARQPIDTSAIVASLKRPEDGAAVVFEGVVRNHTRNRRTLYLDYEAYEEMALRQMEQLASRALSDFQVRDVAIIHRLGRLEIGETSVLIVVAAAHRAAAFDACRWLIDTLKRTVPIWKKEYFEDGAVWADGEPFPPEVSIMQSSRGERSASK
jgi:MoaE-MoaD fusion protein